jgi:hypothetical protein
VRRIRDVLRLKTEAQLSDRQIAAMIGSARSTVQQCLRRARAAGIGWPLLAELDDDTQFARPYPQMPTAPRYPTPGLPTNQTELARRGVTPMLLCIAADLNADTHSPKRDDHPSACGQHRL